MIYLNKLLVFFDFIMFTVFPFLLMIICVGVIGSMLDRNNKENEENEAKKKSDKLKRGDLSEFPTSMDILHMCGMLGSIVSVCVLVFLWWNGLYKSVPYYGFSLFIGLPFLFSILARIVFRVEKYRTEEDSYYSSLVFFYSYFYLSWVCFVIVYGAMKIFSVQSNVSEKFVDLVTDDTVRSKVDQYEKLKIELKGMGIEV